MKAYTYNDRLVGVGNDQILGTDQGGGGSKEYYAGQYISIDENDVISVTGLAPVSAIPVISLNGDDQVTAIDGHTLADGGSTYTAGDGIDITNDVISVDIPYLTITNNTNTSEVTYGDLKALCNGTKIFNLRYGNLMYYVARATRVGSHCELIFSTPNLNTEYDNYQENLIYTKFKYYITAWFFTDEKADSAVAYINGIAIKHVSLNTQPNWNETNTLSETYIQNKPAIPTVPSAGNMLSVSNDTLNVTTTAGITDIVSVSALPANPVATVIYLIPET